MASNRNSETRYWVALAAILLLLGLVMFDGVYRGPMVEVETYRNYKERMIVPSRTPVLVRLLSSPGNGWDYGRIWRPATPEEMKEIERRESVKRAENSEKGQQQ